MIITQVMVVSSVLKKFIEEEGRKISNVRVKIIRNDENLGYAGGMNTGWEARDPDSKYVAFVNNDLIAMPESLAKLVEYMEGNEKNSNSKWINIS